MKHETYIREGTGREKAVLFIHGFLGSTMHFERFIARLPEEYGAYNLLLKGHGGSVRDFGGASMQAWKNQVDEAAGTLCETYKSVYIAGHSMGTFFAMDAAIKYPAVKAVFLMQTPLKIGLRPAAAVNTFKTLFNGIGSCFGSRNLREKRFCRSGNPA